MQIRVEGAVPQNCLPTTEEVDEESGEESASVCDGDGSMGLQVKVKILEVKAGEISPERKTDSRRWTRQRWKGGGKIGRRRNARWLDGITSSWLGARFFLRERGEKTARSGSKNVDLSLKGSGRSKGCTMPVLST